MLRHVGRKLMEGELELQFILVKKGFREVGFFVIRNAR